MTEKAFGHTIIDAALRQLNAARVNSLFSSASSRQQRPIAAADVENAAVGFDHRGDENKVYARRRFPCGRPLAEKRRLVQGLACGLAGGQTPRARGGIEKSARGCDEVGDVEEERIMAAIRLDIDE